ncbi:MAG: addiction module protein [Taibaiella sp.]|nr:addiction module protein [Taibaiella sp.]
MLTFIKTTIVQPSYHIIIKKDYASAIIEDLQKLDAVEVLPDIAYDIPQWQIDEVLKRKKYYQQHPEELLSWEDAQKLIKTE